MFTGLIEEIGIVKNIITIPGGKRISFSAAKILEDISVDDSICTNGVCLTVVEFDATGFTAEAVGETLKKSTYGKILPGQKVNLERSLKLSDRLGGHFVQGHANGIGKILSIKKLGNNYDLQIGIDKSISKYLISEGSIAVNGISLTIAGTGWDSFNISVIPHTWKNTSLQFEKEGNLVNIEVDVIAKYVEKMLLNEKGSGISLEWMKNIGY